MLKNLIKRVKDENKENNTGFNNCLRGTRGIENDYTKYISKNNTEFQVIGDIHDNCRASELYKQIKPLKSPFDKLICIRDWITLEQEKIILSNISKSSIRDIKLIGRRTQMWGGRVTESGIVGKEDLPEWLSSICKTLVHSNIFSEETTPNHVLVNRYDINSGIMPHRDGPLYYPKVAIISLESDTVFDFWEPYIHSDLIEEESDKDKPIFSLIVPRLSLLVFQDQCYTDLLHGISSRLVLMIIVQLVC